jgi:DNA-binding LytR/AlgR family response regulator
LFNGGLQLETIGTVNSKGQLELKNEVETFYAEGVGTFTWVGYCEIPAMETYSIVTGGYAPYTLAFGANKNVGTGTRYEGKISSGEPFYVTYYDMFIAREAGGWSSYYSTETGMLAGNWTLERVEDETAAAVNLKSMLATVVGNVEVVAVLESIEESVEFFKGDVDADVVFMDIHLADGDSFRIFQSVDINIPIIFTTAYDEYALEAFKVNSIDYLLKPFKEEDLQRALDKFYRLTASERSSAKQRREQMVAAAVADSVQTLLVRYKDKIIPVRSEEVAFFYTSEDRVTLTTLDDRRYPVDKTLEMLSQQLPSDKFYRANRQFIVSREAVKDIVVWFGSRLALNLVVETPERIIISKARVADFKQWLQSVHPA